MARKQKKKWRTDPERLRELIEEGTVDCYGEDEQLVGMMVSVIENVVCPFKAKVLGEEVEVTALEEGVGVNAVCRHKGKEYRIDVSSLEWLPERPQGFEWIEAYLAWRENRV